MFNLFQRSLVFMNQPVHFMEPQFPVTTLLFPIKVIRFLFQYFLFIGKLKHFIVHPEYPFQFDQLLLSDHQFL